jgi:hypothetical protein
MEKGKFMTPLGLKLSPSVIKPVATLCMDYTVVAVMEHKTEV